ncbi:sodium/potassium-transporting ATPase subunit beta-1-interacting protein [Cochliomyia hominivorax]
MHERGGMVGLEGDNGELSPKPMTPRRVKRRSVMHRGTNQRQSTTSRRSSSHSSHKNTLRGGGGVDGSGGAGSSGTHSRSSTRSSRRKYHQNPVTKLLDQQQQQQQHTMHIHGHHPKQQFGSFHHKDTSAALTASNLQSLNQEIHNNINAVASSMTAGGSLTKTNNNHYQSFRKNIPPDPIYYNTNAQTAYMQQQQWQQMQQQPPSPVTTLDEPQSPTLTLTPSLGGGHYNPTYQHSTTNLNDGEHVDELYNNRPPSVRSSYSNFHGARPMSSYMNSSSNNTENVFVSLVASNTEQNAVTQQSSSSSATSSFQQLQQQQQITHESPSTPPLYQQHPLHQPSLSQHSLPPPPPLPDPPYTASQPQPIPFHKRTASRESIRSMAFLNSGPPAYNLNYHTPPDSETTM